MIPPYSLPAFLFPSLLCVPFGMTVVPLSQIPSPYPFSSRPVPTGDGAKLSVPRRAKIYIIHYNRIDG
ncbi:MAG: hypothetical protein EOM44_13670 [Bacteroidia bacterium]|nr:hypothetical protein [Bacteroidia bacterium]